MNEKVTKARTPGLCLLLVVLAMAASAARGGEALEYKDGDTVLEGYIARPEGTVRGVPGILIVHQWMGVTAHERDVSERLAAKGYVALACDIYGKGQRPKDRTEAGQFAGRYKGDTALFRRRLKAGLAALAKDPAVDTQRLAVIGYCFGGTGALELGRSGANVKAIVSFHGGLGSDSPQDARQIQGAVLICHGGNDRHVPDKELLAVMDELRATDVDWTVQVYGHAVHGFTHRHDAERYNEKADRRSWKAMQGLFEETFGRPAKYRPVER